MPFAKSSAVSSSQWTESFCWLEAIVQLKSAMNAMSRFFRMRCPQRQILAFDGVTDSENYPTRSGENRVRKRQSEPPLRPYPRDSRLFSRNESIKTHSETRARIQSGL